MKRFFCTFLCALLLAPYAFGATTIYRTEITAPAGDRTMMELKQHWEANGYPDCVGYMTRGSSGSHNTADTDYRQTDPVEFWEIGVIGDPAPLEALLTESVSNDCKVHFTAAQNSRNELLALYPEVVKDYCRDIACGSIVFHEDRIRVYVSPLVLGLYEKSAARKYGGRVELTTPWISKTGIQKYDENGNLFNDGWQPFTFELFVFGSAAALALLLLVFGVWLIVRGVKKLRRRRVCPAEVSAEAENRGGSIVKHTMRKAFLISLACWCALVGLTAGLLSAFARPSAASVLDQLHQPYDDTSRIIHLPSYYLWLLRFSDPPDTEISVTDEMVDAAIEEELIRHAQYVPVAGRTQAQQGDFAKLDYIASKDGEVLSVHNDMIMEIGGGIYDTDFTEQLVGLSVGETKTFSYNSSELGSPEAYTIEATLLAILEESVPVLDDSFVKVTYGLDSVEQFRSQMYERLKSDEDTLVREACVQKAVTLIFNECSSLINHGELNDATAAAYEQAAALNPLMSDEERLNLYAQLENVILRDIKTRLVIDAVAEREGITLSDAELADAGGDAYAARYEKVTAFLLKKSGWRV